MINAICNFQDGIGAATAATVSSVGLTSHTIPIATIATSCNRSLLGLGVPLSHAPKTALSSYNSNTSSLVFDAREPLCVKYK